MQEVCIGSPKEVCLFVATIKTILNNLNEFSSIFLHVIYVKVDAISSPKEVCIVQQPRQFLILK